MSELSQSRLDRQIEAVKQEQQASRQAVIDRQSNEAKRQEELERRADELLSLIETTLSHEAERRSDVFEYVPQPAEPGIGIHLLRCKLTDRQRTLVIKAHFVEGFLDWSIAGKAGARNQNQRIDLLAVDKAFLDSLIFGLVSDP